MATPPSIKLSKTHRAPEGSVQVQRWEHTCPSDKAKATHLHFRTSRCPPRCSPPPLKKKQTKRNPNKLEATIESQRNHAIGSARPGGQAAAAVAGGFGRRRPASGESHQRYEKQRQPIDYLTRWSDSPGSPLLSGAGAARLSPDTEAGSGKRGTDPHQL